MLGAVKRFTSSAHAQTNGMVERLNHCARCCPTSLRTTRQIGMNCYCMPSRCAQQQRQPRHGISPERSPHRTLPKATNDNYSRRTWSQGPSRTQTRPVRFSPTHARKAEYGVRVSEERGFLNQGEASGCQREVKLDLPTTAQLRCWTMSLGLRRLAEEASIF